MEFRLNVHAWMFPLGTLNQVSILWGVVVVLILVVAVMAYRFGRRGSPGGGSDADVREAGRWVLERAGSAVEDESGTLSGRLERWLHMEVEKGVAQKGVALTSEIEADLELARDFQFAYINRPYPKIPETHLEGRLRLEFYHRYEAALALGGDFFDLIPLAPDTAGVFVADVMGHGARSALITAILRTLLRDLRAQGRNARHYITEVNRELCEIMKSFPQPLFASAFYFVPDTTSRMATYSTAGHPAPFHVHRATGQITRLNAPPPHGAALGLIPDEDYSGANVRLIDGDCFIFFTDGVYEAANLAGDEFGLDRMKQVIRKFIYKSNRTIVDELMKAVTEFVGTAPVNDDICIVSVDVTTQAEARKKGA